MVGIIDVDLHQMRTWNGLRPDYANDLSTRGCENDGSIVELSTIAALPVIRNRSGNTGFYLSSELEVNGWFRSSASGLGAPHQLNYQWLDQAILFY
jgi:hypothetical protein